MPEISVDIESKRPVIAANLEELRYLVFYGMTGDDGKSAYELAVELGFAGTEQDWINSLHGADGKDGKNYGIVVDGSVDDVLELKSQELNIGVPTKTSDLTNDSGFISLMITEQPEDVAAANQAVISFYVVAVGKTPLTYQWQISDDGGTTWTNSSVTTTRYRTTLTTEKYGRKVRCVVTDGNGQSVTSRAATMSLYPFATVATSGSYNDLSDKPTIPAGLPAVTALDSGKVLKVDNAGEWGLGVDETGGDSATIDSTPTSGSTNAVSSGGVYTALSGKQDTLHAGTGIIIANNEISASGGSVGWQPLTTQTTGADIILDVSTGVNSVGPVEAYYCAALGIVRLMVRCALSSGIASGNNVNLQFNSASKYKPKINEGTNTEEYGVAYANIHAGTLTGAAVCSAYKTSTLGVIVLHSVAPDNISGSDDYFFHGFYYTEDLPTIQGGES